MKSRHFHKILLAAALVSLISLRVNAQKGYNHSIELDASPGLTLHTSPYFSGSNSLDHSFGPMIQGSLRWSATFADGSYASQLWPGMRIGIGLKGLSLLKPSLTGTPVGLFAFQGADLVSFSSRLSLGYEWQFGATGPWQILSSKHPDQTINGSPVCALLGASVLLRYRLSAEWTLSGGIDLAHYSNGNTRWPNAGTNTAGVRVGISRYIGSSGRQPALTRTDTIPLSELSRRQRWGVDLLVYGAWRKKCFHDLDDRPLPFPGSFGVAGINISPSYRLSRRFSAGPSIDLVFDESAMPQSYIIDSAPGEQPFYIRPPFFRQTAIGLSAQAEYSMPVFSLHVGLGYNALAGCSELRYFYQTLALRTYITSKLWLNVGYSLRNFAHPRHLMLGVGIRLGGTGSPLPLSRL